MTTSTYHLICGAEIHVELKTKSKMFCGCKNDPFGAEKPNIYTCPVCLGLPGGLPVPNKAAIESTILLGLALGSTIPEHAHFDRKHYFYPDLPKGYQISQQSEPFCIGGQVETSYGPVRINHIHLEEDAAKMHHEVVDGRKVSLIDYNRSSVPLMEIVTEPDITSPEMAKEFLKNVRDIIRSLGISDCDMEKGSMRLEANISLSPSGPGPVGAGSSRPLPPYKVEVKNINSFRFFANTMEYEAKRQAEILDRGELPVQETRGYRDATKSTVSQRTKEGAADYRYFPDGDIPAITVSPAWVNQIRARLPRLPAERLAELTALGVSETAAKILLANPSQLAFFQETLDLPNKPNLPNLANMLANKKIDPSTTTPEKYAADQEALTSSKVTDPAVLTPLIEKAIAENPNVAADYRAGKQNALGFFVGQIMRATSGKADPAVVNKLLQEILV
jgi:aspartyl-tRNA(Asn)/glutamyl-tRNA(Gln) amidotransferase subunit B